MTVSGTPTGTEGMAWTGKSRSNRRIDRHLWRTVVGDGHRHRILAAPPTAVERCTLLRRSNDVRRGAGVLDYGRRGTETDRGRRGPVGPARGHSMGGRIRRSWRPARSSPPSWTCSCRSRHPPTTTTRCDRSAAPSPSSPRSPPVSPLFALNVSRDGPAGSCSDSPCMSLASCSRPLFFGGEVNAVTETIWGLWWVAIGAVLIRAGRSESI